MPLWEGTAPTRDSDLLKCDFPPDWPNLCGVCFPAYAARNDPTVVWNRKHELVVQLDPDDFRAVTRIMKPVSPDSWLLRRSDPLLYRSELLNSPRLSAAFIGFCISQGEQELWSGLRERDPAFLPAAWKNAFGEDHVEGVLFWDQSSSALRTVSPTKWTVVRSVRSLGKKTHEVLGSELPKPEGTEWIVEDPLEEERIRSLFLGQPNEPNVLRADLVPRRVRY